MEQDRAHIAIKAWTPQGRDLGCVELELAPDRHPPDADPKEYVECALSFRLGEMSFAVTTLVGVSAIHAFAGDLRRLDAGDPRGGAFLWDDLGQAVLAITWVRTFPPSLVMSGEYTQWLVAWGTEEPEIYPFGGKNTVTFTGLVVSLSDADGLAGKLYAALRELGFR